MKRILLVFLWVQSYFIESSEIILIRTTENLYFKQTNIGAKINIISYESNGYIKDIYLGKDANSYIIIEKIGFQDTKEKLKSIEKKYDDLISKDKSKRLIIEKEKDKEIDKLFKNRLYNLIICYNNRKSYFNIGYINSSIFIMNNLGEKIFNNNLFDYLISNYPEMEVLINFWRCKELNDSKFNCNAYTFSEEYLPCEKYEFKIGIECPKARQNENKIVNNNADVIYKVK